MPVFLTAVATLGGLSVVLAGLLVVASRRLRVDEDPRIDVVEAMLPHANCGACGQPGCRAFAEALVLGAVRPGRCTVASDDERVRIAAFLGVDVGAEEKRVARLACAGGTHVARHRARYRGLPTCAAAAQVAGGGRGCTWSCLGLGDCERACDFAAIHMDVHHLPVVDEARCTACGDCVTACPKDLFSIHPVSHQLWVACRSHLAGDAVLDDCEVACTACGRCAADAPGVVVMRDDLPVVDYAAGAAPRAAIERCPTGAIVWIGRDGRAEKGAAATRVVRREPRRDTPT
jgi:Na+-translocating ferredoxin:NAD+ oxidoreductase RNF subunit RnfB